MLDCSLYSKQREACSFTKIDDSDVVSTMGQPGSSCFHAKGPATKLRGSGGRSGHIKGETLLGPKAPILTALSPSSVALLSGKIKESTFLFLYYYWKQWNYLVSASVGSDGVRG